MEAPEANPQVEEQNQTESVAKEVDPPSLPPRSRRPTQLTAVNVEYNDLNNGEPISAQVQPNEYVYFKASVPGTEEDVVRIYIERTIQSGGINLYANYPYTSRIPTADSHDWNPTKGALVGPAGDYQIAVQGATSFHAEDDEEIEESQELAQFELTVTWEVLDENERAIYKKVSAQYSHEKASSIWASSYSEEFKSKYEQQQKEFLEELEEREKQSQKTLSLENIAFLNDYVIGDTIGSSGISTVKQVTKKSDGNKYGLKIIDKEEAALTGLSEDDFTRQIKLLSSFKNPHIPTFIESSSTEKLVLIVQELCSGGEILPVINESASFSEADARSIVSQVLNVLKYLHDQNISHGAVTPDNVVFSKKGANDIKLVGFSMARNLATDTNVKVIGGNPPYQTPEALLQQDTGLAADIYQVGLLSYILLSGTHPFDDSNTMRLYNKIKQGNFTFAEANWKNVSAAAQDFVKTLMATDPKARPQVNEALKHAWFSSSASSNNLNIQSKLAAVIGK